MRYALSEVRKTLIGVVGFALTIAATVLAVGPDLIPNKYLPWVLVAIAVGTNYGIFKVPNRPAPGQPSKPDVSETDAPVVTALSHLDDHPEDHIG